MKALLHHTPGALAAKRGTVLLALALLLAVSMASSTPASQALAQSGGSYELTWNTIDSGGYMFSTADGYALGGTIGQPDAGTAQGGAYTLTGGFWVAGKWVSLHLPFVSR